MSKARIAVWDNAKWLMVVLVILGHVIEGIQSEDLTANWLYTLIYLFHMPVLMFVSGYFSRAEASWKTAYGVAQLLIVYLIWEVLIGGLRYALTGWTPTTTFLTTPSWSMWFLLSLASLKILLPFVMLLRRPLLVAVIVSLASGAFLELDATLSLSRTLGFLPFFVGGHVVRERGLMTADWFQRPSAALRVTAGAVLAGVAAALWALVSLREEAALYRWAFHRDSYWKTTLNDEARIDVLPVDEITESTALVILNGALVTALFIGLAVLTGMAVLMLIPRSTSVLTRIGQSTLYIYLLHIPLVRTLRRFEVAPDLYERFGTWAVALIAVGSIVAACLMGSAMVRRLLHPVVEPNVSALLREQRTT